MSNPNSQLDGLGSFNQSSQNAGTIKYGAFNNASRNLGTIALSAVFGNTSINQGTIGDVLPIVTASLVQQNSANWDAAYTTVLANSAMWALSGGSGGNSGGGTGDATNAPIWDAAAAYLQAMSASFVTLENGHAIQWDAVYTNVMSNSAAWMSSDTTNAPAWNAAASFVQSNSASLVYTNDSRLADVPNGNIAYTYLQANSGDFVMDGDSRLSNSRTPTAHTHDASAIVSGKIDVARLPLIPSQEQVLITGVMYTSAGLYYGGNDHFTDKLTSINQGTIVTTTDGYRWVYAGSGDKRYDTSYVLLADITPDWSVISNKPASFPVDAHTQEISSVNGLQTSLNTLQSNIDGKQASGNYALATDSRFTVLAANSGQWGSGTVEGHSAYTYVNANSASLVSTSDSRLSDSRTPLTHSHGISDVTGLQTSLDGKASTSSLDNKASLSALNANVSAVDSLTTLIQENSATWDGVGTVYNYFRSTSAAAVYSDDVRLAKASTAYSYLTSTSASLVTTAVLNSSISGKADSSALSVYATTAVLNSSIAGKADSSALSGYVSISDSRLSQATTVYTQVQSNSAGWAAGTAGSINYTIDGGGIAITTGSKGFVQVPSNFIVQEWDIIADLQTTSFIVDVRKSSYANLPTTTSIVGADFMTLSNQQKNRNMSVSWTNVSAGDFVEFYVTDASNASMINISLKGIRS
jgi:hypothetical protein